MSDVVIRMDTTGIDRMLRETDADVEDILEAVAFEVERDAKISAPVKTGALRSSIYTRTKGSGGKPTGDAEIPEPTGKVIATVGPSVDYGIWVELGTRRMGARPFLGPAAEKWQRKINEGSLYKRLVQK